MATQTNSDENLGTEDNVNREIADSEAAECQPIQLSYPELAVELVALVLWFCLFSGGLLISTQKYRQALINPAWSWDTLSSWLAVVTCWTITNVGLLACAAAFLGALGRRTHFTHQTILMSPP